MTVQTQPKSRKTLRDRLLNFIEVAAVIVLVVMMLHVVLNALSRSLFKMPIYGTLELTQFWYLPALTLLGLIAAQARNEHIVADLLFDSFPAIMRKWTSFSVNVITAVVAALISWYGLSETVHAFDKMIMAGATDFPLWPIEALLTISYAAFAIQLLYTAVKIARFGEEIDPDGIPNDDGVGFGDDPIAREEDLRARGLLEADATASKEGSR
ncbi:TRAP-type C4-dicarboxylate transport system permease small subunit [Leucobacter exalbidus]|uniref:TRAP-type C4-dicarboxylate transport system permease small subunit n=1 Tax=Leucobacter exalbidus TaxID=662960 RepID=A0A940PQK0_9MICO|nr:TRAP transporter small permease [Leucobacter exalbidus]MBP1327310.1 TRAP-type C4-dicarboxylate transport system permease small subunit [Leucobacter exalbidus]